MSSQGLKKGTLLRHGAYRIETILGQGGFGITYLATDLSLDGTMAGGVFKEIVDYMVREKFVK